MDGRSSDTCDVRALALQCVERRGQVILFAEEKRALGEWAIAADTRATEAERERDKALALLDALPRSDAMARRLSKAEHQVATLTAALEATKRLLAQAKPWHLPGECPHCGIDELPPETCVIVRLCEEIDAALAKPEVPNGQ